MSKIEVNEIDAQSGSTITVGSACKSVAVPGNVVKTNAVQASDAGNIISQSGTTITINAGITTIVPYNVRFADYTPSLGIMTVSLDRLHGFSAGQAIKFKPDLAEAHSNLGTILKELDNSLINQ